jgi:hypothetical protein
MLWNNNVLMLPVFRRIVICLRTKPKFELMKLQQLLRVLL